MQFMINWYTENINKIAKEIELMKNKQNEISENNLNENKQINNEISNMKSQLKDFILSNNSQNSDLIILENEISIFKNPNLFNSNEYEVDENKISKNEKQEININTQEKLNLLISVII